MEEEKSSITNIEGFFFPIRAVFHVSNDESLVCHIPYSFSMGGVLSFPAITWLKLFIFLCLTTKQQSTFCCSSTTDH